MIIVFRTEAGYAAVQVDKHGISFVNNEAYFSDGYEDYIIPADSIMTVQDVEGGLS